MIGLREDEDLENHTFVKNLHFPKASLSFSQVAHVPCRMYFSFQETFSFTLYLLLHHLNLFLTRQATLGTLALNVGSCGPGVRSPDLGN